MTKAKISVDFSSGKYTDKALSVEGNRVIEKMTNNPAFPNPEPPLETLRVAVDNFFNALDNVKDGSKADTSAKNDLRAILENTLKQVANYVQRVSNDDETTILSSGFDIHQKREVVGPLEKAANLVVKPGANKGSLKLSCNPVPHARFYEFEYREIPASNGNGWQKLTTTKHQVLVEGLTSGKQYSFRVAGAGSDPSRVWSDENTSFVL